MERFKKLTKVERILVLSVPLIALALIISLKFKGISEFSFLILGALCILFILNIIINVFKICKCENIRNLLPQIIIACIIITVIYILILLNSNRILTWDFGSYYGRALASDELFTDSFYRGVKELMHSIWMSDYSNFIVLFTSLLFHFTDKSSNMYVIANIIFIIYPLIIVLIALINKIVKENKLLLWIATFIIATLPFLHFTAIMGQPDIFGLFFIMCILLLTYDYDFKTIDCRRLVYLFITTICLLISRRWYAFWIVSFYFSYIIYIICSNIKDKKLLKIKTINIIKFGAISLIIGGIALGPMIYKILGNSYSTAYEAYDKGGFSFEIVNQFGKLGIVTLIFILVGLIYGIYKEDLRKLTIVITFTGIISMALFTRVQNMNNHQSLILMPTYIFLIIISLMCFYNIRSSIIKAAIFSLICSFFVTNFISSLTIENNKDIVFTNVSIKPIVREDMDEISEIVDFINENCNEDNKIQFISSTQEYNVDTFRNFLLPDEKLSDKICNGFSVDLVHGFPIGVLDAKYILISDPVQLGETALNNQMLIPTIVDAIINNKSISKNFEYIKTFPMREGVVFKLYERKNGPTKEECNYYIETFNKWYSNYPELYENRIKKFME